jgi:hemerythrin-like domain-containing protein
MLEEYKNKMAMPLKRHTALIPLSQDHHGGLLLVWKIRQGLKSGVEGSRIVDYLNYFAKNHLEPHFLIEEELVFSYLGKNDSMRMQAEQEHELLRSQIREFEESELEYEKKLSLFAQTLEGHIRFEERILFQHMQAELMEKDLSEMEAAISKVYDKFQEHWKDEFWVVKK